MAKGRHAAPGASFRASVVRNLAGGAGLVAAVSVLFWGIGSIGRADTLGPPLDGVEEAAAPEGDGLAPSDVAAGPGSDDPDGSGPTEPQDGPDPDPEEATGAAAPDDPGDHPDDPDEPADADDGTDDGSADTGPSIPPAEISVQVLDGHKADGGSAANAVASALEAAGYRVVARNPAVRYEQTTVLWTPGNEAAARQVAAEIGATQVREQPGNLSNAVTVHVVVGDDRG